MAKLIVCLKESHLLNNNGSIIQVSTTINKDDIYLRKKLDDIAITTLQGQKQDSALLELEKSVTLKILNSNLRK